MNIQKEFNFGPGEASYEKSVFSIGNQSNEFDFLIFFDSRGYKRENENYPSLYELVSGYIKDRDLTALIINRPKNLTVFPTLINFIRENDLRFKYLLTNIGFVDCTPKKKEFIEDIREQIKAFHNENLIEKKLGNYILSSGMIASLYSFDYSDPIIRIIAETISNNFQNALFLSTPVIPKSTYLKRKRPDSFFDRLISSNELIRKICKQCKGIYVDVSSFEESTFDGVHFTRKGITEIYKKTAVNINKIIPTICKPFKF